MISGATRGGRNLVLSVKKKKIRGGVQEGLAPHCRKFFNKKALFSEF